jgi:hypothetical protein
MLGHLGLYRHIIIIIIINHSSIQCNTHTHIYNLYNMYTYIDCILTHNNCTNRNDHRYLAVS